MLDIVQNNPYRLLGIYSNSSTKERVANHNRLKAFLKVGKAVSFPLDIPSLLPPIERTAENVSEADAKLTLPNGRLHYAQFWFVKATQMDDDAMNHLIAGNMQNAQTIWEKEENVSSLQNRLLCALIQNDYMTVLTCADKLYSYYLTDFANIVLGENHTEDTKELAYQFLDELTATESLHILPYIANNDWRQYVLDKSITPLIATLQAAIDTTKSSKGKGAMARLTAGTKLMNETRKTLKSLHDLCTDTDLRYQTIADKLGLEILQCGIDYYNGSEVADAAYNAMKLQSYALSVAIGQTAKERCRENVDILQKIINGLPPQEVSEEYKAIQKQLQKFTQLPDKICYAVNLLNNTRPHLQAIKKKLGAENTYYLKLSTQVVRSALYNITKEVNNLQLDKETPIAQVKSVLRAAWNAIMIVDTFDMEYNFKINRYSVNRSTLKKMCEQTSLELNKFNKIINITLSWLFVIVVIMIVITLIYNN